MKKANLTITVKQPDVTVRPGEYVTVWLQSATADGFPQKQVELRVLENGTPQIFVDGIKSRQFNVWTDPDQEGQG